MSTVRVEDSGGIRHVMMARPERRNAFNAELIADLKTLEDLVKRHFWD